MPLDISEYNGLKVIKFYGKLDVNVALSLEIEVLEFIESFNYKVLIIDVLECQYISASMAHLFLSVEKHATHKGLKICVIGSSTVKKIFDNIGISSFEVYDSIENATRNFNI